MPVPHRPAKHDPPEQSLSHQHSYPSGCGVALSQHMLAGPDTTPAGNPQTPDWQSVGQAQSDPPPCGEFHLGSQLLALHRPAQVVVAQFPSWTMFFEQVADALQFEPGLDGQAH